MSHHPSSAELAAFRRSIAHDPRYLDTIRWEDERGHGIGYRIPLQDHDSGILSTARREASALRSRAYARMESYAASVIRSCVLSHEHVGGIDPFGMPYTSDGLDCHPDTDPWDDAPRSPLPIRYQPSFVITR